MAKRLSEYQLGIFMPHMHDEASGAFQPLPEGILQLESGLDGRQRAGCRSEDENVNLENSETHDRWEAR